LVILNVSHFCCFGDANHAGLVDLLKNKCKSYLATNFTGDVLTTPFKSFINNGIRVIIIYDDDYILSHPESGFFRELNIYKEYANKDDYGEMRSDQLKKLHENSATPQKMFLLSWTITFIASSTPFKFLNYPLYISLRDLTRPASRNLARFLAENSPGSIISIVHSDFLNNARTTDCAIMLNRVNAGMKCVDVEDSQSLDRELSGTFEIINIIKSFSISKKIMIGRKVIIKSDKNAVITRDPSYKGIMIENDGELTLQNVVIDGHIDGGFADTVMIMNNGTFIMESGTMLRNNISAKSTRGGAVCNYNVFRMEGGTIQNNRACFVSSSNASYNGYGGGVYNYSNFMMFGDATINDNIADIGGGGVFNIGIFDMRGGAILNNKIPEQYATNNGGGVYNCETFNMYDGKISKNEAVCGAGVMNNNLFSTATVFCMNGGIISENIAKDSGGGIYNYGNNSLTSISDLAQIEKNCAQNGNGGGIYNFATLNICGGIIRENTALNGGGIFQHSGKITLLDGSVILNTAGSKGKDIFGKIFVKSGSPIVGSINLGTSIIIAGGGEESIKRNTSIAIEDLIDREGASVVIAAKTDEGFSEGESRCFKHVEDSIYIIEINSAEPRELLLRKR
jgi:hypothetical protein